MGILELQGKVPQISDKLAERDQKKANTAIRGKKKKKK